MILNIPTQSSASTPIDTQSIAWSATRSYTLTFTPSESQLARTFAMWTRADGRKIIVPATSGYFDVSGDVATFSAAQHPNPNVGTLKFALCEAPAFTVPIGARGISIRNVSGADMWIRSYIPSYDETGHLIDIVPQALTDDTLVGQLLAHGETQSYLDGGFTPGQSFVIAAASAATDGCIVEFAY